MSWRGRRGEGIVWGEREREELGQGEGAALKEKKLMIKWATIFLKYIIYIFFLYFRLVKFFHGIVPKIKKF